MFYLLYYFPVLIFLYGFRVKHLRSINTVQVWDIFVRAFHWLLVCAFFGAYFSAQYKQIVLHEMIGYGLIVLLFFRLLWGFFGSPYARFKSFIFSPRETLDYLKTLRAGSPKHYFGHNPLGALMVFTLLSVLGVLVLSGLISLAGIEFEGPLQSLVVNLTDADVYFVQNLYEFLATTMLFLVFFHVSGSIRPEQCLPYPGRQGCVR